MRDRGVRLMLILAVVLLALTVADFFLWLSIDGVDCHPSCNAGQDVSGIALVALPAIALLLVLASLVRWMRRRRSAGA